MKKVLLALLFVVILSVPALAGNAPTLPTDGNGNWYMGRAIWDGSTFLGDTTYTGTQNVASVATTSETFGACAFDAASVVVTLDQTYNWVYITSDTDIVIKLNGTPANKWDGDLIPAGGTLVYNHEVSSVGAITQFGVVNADAALRVRGLR